jgi:hypothetical protein
MNKTEGRPSRETVPLKTLTKDQKKNVSGPYRFAHTVQYFAKFDNLYRICFAASAPAKWCGFDSTSQQVNIEEDN